MKQKDSITWLQFNNIVPVLVGLVMTAFSISTIYWRLNSKLDLAIQKLDNIALIVQSHQEESKELSARMTKNVQERDNEISTIQQQIASIKAILKIQ